MFMTAMSVIPVAGMVGGAVDLSRAYLVKARMQQACDAGALAGRRSMSGTTVTTTDKQEALRFFYFNFPQNTMGSTTLVDDNDSAVNRVSTALSADKQFEMSATTAVPTTLLRVVGMNEMRVDVACKAEEYYVNTDLMMVLDTTGSMNCYLSDATSCHQSTEKTTNGTKKAKMLELRDALKALYVSLRPAQLALEAKSLRMRIGMVQYSSTANVGKLVYAKNSAYIRNPYTYYKSDGTADTATNRAAAWFTGTWLGCIEERQTTTALTKDSTSIPAAAYDLDIAKIPDSDATRWGPYDESSEKSKSTSNYYDSACPKPAVAMKSWASTTEFNTQVDTILQGDGNTYHDIGMNWGVRMIANTGIFGADNPDKYNNVKVRRTIVFMTDGDMAPNRSGYSAYSVARYAGRVASTGTSDANLELIHVNRFKLMCAKAKSDPLNIDVWVVAMLDHAMDSYLSGCASNADQAILVSDAQDLADAFKKISDKVGNLRIGQ
ncbi:TadE/TadG family type IV pilus assembly protein [Sphingobium boeckii]|nr:TadE/TadG family type IV pilus assembly protein [Sphingobium boeckii]